MHLIVRVCVLERKRGRVCVCLRKRLVSCHWNSIKKCPRQAFNLIWSITTDLLLSTVWLVLGPFSSSQPIRTTKGGQLGFHKSGQLLPSLFLTEPKTEKLVPLLPLPPLLMLNQGWDNYLTLFSLWSTQVAFHVIKLVSFSCVVLKNVTSC